MDPTWSIINTLFTLGLFVALFFFLRKKQDDLQVEVLNDQWQRWDWTLRGVLLGHQDFKTQWKEFRKQSKQQEKLGADRALFYLQFQGDFKASEVDHLREEITAILQAARPGVDQVLLQLSSPGGVVQDYGLGASQLQRLIDAGLELWVSVDTVAASGGYLMACVAKKIIAAPFAVIGSIGVVAQVPNFHRLLKKWDIDYKEYTAGEFKRTVSLLGEITPKGEQKFIEQLESTHQFFKEFVRQHRPQVAVDDLATGEYWYGKKALELGLADELKTTDDVLLSKAKEGFLIVKVKYIPRRSLSQKWSEGLVAAVEKRLLKWLGSA